MSSEALPISPSAFASALKDLPLTTLHLKAAELRNSIAHLDYSNEQLKPFASGTETGIGGAPGEPDQDCIDAINENLAVIERMKERIALLRAEVESRGSSWGEFMSAEELEKEGALINGTAAQEEPRSDAWTDGTFQTGRIVNGEVRMNSEGAAVNGNQSAVNGTNTHTGGSLDDETLRRQVEERMRAMMEAEHENDEEGIHL